MTPDQLAELKAKVEDESIFAPVRIRDLWRNRAFLLAAAERAERAEAECERLREALEFYAEESVYKCSAIYEDVGERARAALSPAPAAEKPKVRGRVRCFRRADGQTIEGCDRIRFRSHGTCEMVYRDDTFEVLSMHISEAERAVSRGIWVEVNDSCAQAHPAPSPDAGGAASARRLRGPDYKAEAMAAREFIRGDGRGRDYLAIRTTNESKEAANG